jgi:DNA invertase Pin-like site-specific DNA recombinase
MEGRVIRTIPATVNRFTAVPINCMKKRKTAGYARVSTDMEEQLTSYEAQVKYYTEYIKSRADWEFVDVYTDEGITGTSTRHRKGFNQMIADAMDDKIDLIITKSVSRFARNTVDSLTTIRKLKEKGVECYFEKENIWTFDDKCELMLTIMSSIAQEEARSISENCIWGQRRRFAEGKVAVPFKSFLGYERGEDGNLVVNEEQAKLVRRIYGMFLSGQSAYAIARILTKEGVPTPAGKQKWYMSTIKSILTNEKYKGDALLQKTYTADFLTKQKKINNGEIPQYYVKNNHEAIIDREIFDEVQKLIGRTKSGKGRQSSISIFSSKIKCGECGSYYGSKVWHSNDKYRRVIWQCNHKFDNDRKCETPHLDEETIKQSFISAMNKLITNKNNIIADFEIIKNEVFGTADKTAKKETIELFIRNLKKQSCTITEFDECLWMCMVDFITVNSRDDIQVTFKNGTTVKA